MKTMKILMVCLGNICRSPLAHGIMEQKILENGLDWRVDSCGTGSWHVGQAPDSRSVEVASQNGIDITHQRARTFSRRDLDDFDLILAMDSQNYRDIIRHAGPSQERKVEIIMNYVYPDQNRAVPDPYYEGGFDRVYEMLSRACQNVIEKHMYKS